MILFGRIGSGIMKRIKFLTTILLILLVLLINIVTIATAQYDSYSSFTLAGACFFLIIIWFIIFLLISIWVYKDAERRGKSGALWLIIVILLGLIGIIIWLIVRPPIKREEKKVEDDRRRCPNCGRIIPFDAKFCPYCNKKFEVY
jgi:membrane protease YdiL (CAAX protease family)